MQRIIDRKRPGFTLIELLVVVAIIAVLAALLFPVYAGAKGLGRRAKCQHNLQQIGRAFQLYLSDYADCYPNLDRPYLWMGREWRWPLKRYVLLAANRDPSDPDNPYKSVGRTVSVLKCPEDETPKEKWDDTSYGYAACFYHNADDVDRMTVRQLWDPSDPGPPCVTQRTTAVIEPSRKAMVSEWLANHTTERNAKGAKFGWWEWGGARNYLFADGHVRFLDSRAILPPASGEGPDINRTRRGIAGRDI